MKLIPSYNITDSINYPLRVGIGISLSGLLFILFFINDLELTALSIVGVFTGLMLAISGGYIAVKSDTSKAIQ
jgi:VIT1/CCC1 family predicted Fe2+/Mn2+ transporter